MTYRDINGIAIKLEDVDLGFEKNDTYFKNLNLEVKKGEIVFHKDVTIKQISFSRFHIFDPHIGRDGR